MTLANVKTETCYCFKREQLKISKLIKGSRTGRQTVSIHEYRSGCNDIILVADDPSLKSFHHSSRWMDRFQGSLTDCATNSSITDRPRRVAIGPKKAHGHP